MQNSSSRLERLALLEKEREIFNQKQSSTLAIAGSFVGSSADLEQSAACFSQQDIRQNIKNIDGKHSYIEKSFKASSPTKKVNPWNRLVVNTEKSRIKYHGTDKTLIVLLEEERIKYTQLENEYHSLLNHVNELSASHSEAQTINAKEFEKQRKVMQEKIDKTRIEYSMLEQDFTRSIEKNKEQVFGLQKDKQNLENHVGRIKELLNESESQVSRLEKHDKEVSHQYDICKQKMIERDSTILKLNNASNQQELSRLKEKESLMKMEVRVLQLDHAFSNSRSNLESQKAINEKLTEKIANIPRLEAVIDEVKKDLDASHAREKKLGNEISRYREVESKMLLEIEKLNQQNKMMNLDLERLSGIESLHAQDLEKFKSEESKRRSEIATLTSRAQNLSAENALLNQQLQQSVDEHGKLSLALVETQGKLSHNDKLNTQKDITLKDQETRLAQLTFDSVQSTNKINQLYNQLETKSHQLEQMESNINEISALYDAEVEKNVKLKTGSIDKFQQLSSTIETLSADLADRQSVVDTLRKEQLNYRQDLKNREQTNQTLETQLEELTDQNQKNSNTVKNLQRKIQNDESSNRKIILELEDKFAFLVESFTQEKESLLKKHNQKQSQFEHLTDQFQRIKTDLQNSSVENAQLQSTVAELKMNEEKLNRQIKNLTQHVNASASEKHANELKVGVLSDHVSRLEAQLGGAGNGVAREQVDMLSRKLKSQVDMLGLKKEFQGIKIPEFY